MKIRKLRKEDLYLRVMWMNDPRIYNSMSFTPPITYQSTCEWYERIALDVRRYDFVGEIENEIVAFGGVVNIDEHISKAETYIFVNPDLKGKGIGKAFQKELISYGFLKLNLYKLYVYTNESNIGSRNIHQKLGYKLEGRLRGEKLLDSMTGIREDRLYYGLLKNEYYPNECCKHD